MLRKTIIVSITVSGCWESQNLPNQPEKCGVPIFGQVLIQNSSKCQQFREFRILSTYEVMTEYKWPKQKWNSISWNKWPLFPRLPWPNASSWIIAPSKHFNLGLIVIEKFKLPLLCILNFVDFWVVGASLWKVHLRDAFTVDFISILRGSEFRVAS